MEQTQLEQDINNARSGNELARQTIIRNGRPYILNVVSHVCRRFVTWSDDEASIGLLAFNRAIDSFEEGKGRAFYSYAYCLINRDLINFFHKNQALKNEFSLDNAPSAQDLFSQNELPVTAEEIEISIREYTRKVESSELVCEISEMDSILHAYGIGFEELEKASPKHRDTHELMLKIIKDFLSDQDLIFEFIRKRKFPAAALAKSKGYSLKTLEKHRKYLIALLIIKLHPEWEHLSEYVRIE